MRLRVPAAGLLLLLAACGGSKNDDFKTQSDFVIQGTAPSCLVHQDSTPPPAYADDATALPGKRLPFLAYYTAAGAKAFCDGKPANSDDRAWAQLYVRLTSNPTKVSGILG